jgi:hypothetical protein
MSGPVCGPRTWVCGSYTVRILFGVVLAVGCVDHALGVLMSLLLVLLRFLLLVDVQNV